MLLVRKISCSKCKFRGNGNEGVLVSCDLAKCRIKNSYVEVIDTEDNVIESYSIDEFKDMLSQVELDNLSYENGVMYI